MPEPRLIAAPEDLDELVEALEGATDVALDTEFHAERRYRPELLLVQLAVPGRGHWVIDPLNVDLRPLGPALGRSRWLTHGGRLDVELLHEATGGARPTALFDTQIAAGLVGLGFPVRLERLVRTLLNRQLNKGSALTDWSARPLSRAQLAYAVMDSAILPPLAAELEARLADAGRLDFAQAAGAELVAHATSPDPGAAEVDAWRHWEIAPELDDAERRVLAALLRWRTRRARDKDRPPHYVLSDALALDLARRRPDSPSALRANRRLAPGLVRKWGDEILATIQQALADPEPPPVAPDRNQVLLAHALRLWAELQAPHSAIAAPLALPHHLALDVAMQGPEALTGWRREAIGASLRAFLAGEERIEVRGGTPELVPAR